MFLRLEKIELWPNVIGDPVHLGILSGKVMHDVELMFHYGCARAVLPQRSGFIHCVALCPRLAHTGRNIGYKGQRS